tara:strand:+ start:344 stop:883 length:540 start_codon:yes stop_codon:yes gene_type:complete
MTLLENTVLRRSRTMDVVTNAIFFNISWFVIVVTQSALIGPAQAVLHLLLHFWLIGRGVAELRLIAVVLVLGIGVDQLMFASGVLSAPGVSLAPVWLSCLWPVFATTLCHAFRGFHDRTVLAVLLGAFGGAGSYVAGARLSEVDIASPVIGTLVLALVWGVLFPLLLKLAAHWVPEHEA